MEIIDPKNRTFGGGQFFSVFSLGMTHQLNDIAGIGGYLSSNTGGDHLSEPPVEVEVLPCHSPHKVHTVLFGNVVDVTEAGVILKLSN